MKIDKLEDAISTFSVPGRKMLVLVLLMQNARVWGHAQCDAQMLGELRSSEI